MTLTNCPPTTPRISIIHELGNGFYTAAFCVCMPGCAKADSPAQPEAQEMALFHSSCTHLVATTAANTAVRVNNFPSEVIIFW